MGAGAVGGHVNQQSSQGQSLRQPSEAGTMSCEACEVSFTIFKRKLKCHDCGIHHCSSCVTKEANSKEGRRCHKCRMLRSGNFTRRDLMHCKVRDLRSFLQRQNVPTNKCKEKEDLVDLVMLFCSSSQHFRDMEAHQQHVEELRERRRITEEEFRSPRHESQSSESSGTQARNARNSSSSHESVGGLPPQVDTQAEAQQETVEDQAARLQQRQQAEMLETEARLHEELHMNDEIDPRPRRQHMTLDDVAHMDTIEDLNVRQLKEILAANFVDYKGCCEKSELIERVKRLYEARQKSKRIDLDGPGGPSETEVCKICMDAMIDCVLLECGHMITCTTCGRRLHECPICRQYVVRVVHIFKA